MKKSLYWVCCFLYAFAVGANAVTNDAKKIRSVWNLTSQSCNGVPGNSMTRHPEESSIKKSKMIILKELGFRFSVPQFKSVEETVVKLNLGDKTRGVIDNYILISDQDLEAPFAAIVITELPPHMQTRRQAFFAVNTLESQLSVKSGVNVNLEPISGPHGESLEMIINNRVGSYCFPTSDFKVLPKKSKLKTVAISRFSFINGKLVEFTVVINTEGDGQSVKAINEARLVMDAYWSRLEPI